jgi:hypothetical protein
MKQESSKDFFDTYGVPAGSSASLGFNLLCTTKIPNWVAERKASRSDSGYDKSSCSTSFFSSDNAYLRGNCFRNGLHRCIGIDSLECLAGIVNFVLPNLSQNRENK